MPFKPIGDRHAIQEVVFVVGFARDFGSDEIETLVAHHEFWKSDLPKLKRAQVFQFQIGEVSEDQQPPEFVPPAFFQSFKRDGSLDWQLQARDSWLAVNCLSYSRWDAVSRQAKLLLEKALGLVIDTGNKLSHISLQYIDTFVWEGDTKDYNIDLLINRKSGFFSEKFQPSSASWHLHQGMFEPLSESDPPQRILNRIHLDAVEKDSEASVKIDTVLRLDFLGGLAPMIEEVGKLLDVTLDDLHARNKAILSSLINPAVQERISLNKEE